MKAADYSFLLLFSLQQQPYQVGYEREVTQPPFIPKARLELIVFWGLAKVAFPAKGRTRTQSLSAFSLAPSPLDQTCLDFPAESITGPTFENLPCCACPNGCLIAQAATQTRTVWLNHTWRNSSSPKMQRRTQKR